jgi:hypothetical protein
MGVKGLPLIPVFGLDKIITHGGWIQKGNFEESLTKGEDYNIKS